MLPLEFIYDHWFKTLLFITWLGFWGVVVLKSWASLLEIKQNEERKKIDSLQDILRGR